MAKPKQKLNKHENSSGKVRYFEDQFDDEEVLLVFRKHPFVMRKGLVYGMAAWLVGPMYTFVMTFTSHIPTINFFLWSLIGSMVLGLIIFFPSWIGWYFSLYIVTDQRLIQISQKGLFHRAVAGLGLPQIQSVNYEIQGLQETLLGFGTIKMQTYVGDLVIHDVHHPAKIQKQLLSILREEGIDTSSNYPAKPQGTLNQINEEA